MSTTVAFIGLGHMGGPMAANLVRAGHRVLGFDLVPELLADAAATGWSRRPRPSPRPPTPTW